MKEFIELVTQLFPSITPEIAVNTYKAIEVELRGKDRTHIEFIKTAILNEPSQGDIITGLNLPYVNEESDIGVFEDTLGMLLTCGCDFDQDEHVKFALMHPLQDLLDLGFKKVDIINQTITGFMYIPMFQYEGKEYVVDFSLISSFSTDLLKKLISRNITKRVGSLNDFGYHFLLAKLSIHFLRPEDTVSQAERNVS